MSSDLLKRIAIDPSVMVGKPCVRGTRLTVESVLRRLAQGTTKDQLLGEYPRLVADDIDACLFYAAETLRLTPVQTPMPVSVPA